MKLLCERYEKVAEEKFHSTAQQAATIAKKADVKQLMIGHFSARYKTPDVLLREARRYSPTPSRPKKEKRSTSPQNNNLSGFTIFCYSFDIPYMAR